MAPEPKNDTWDMPQLLWNNWTVLTEGENVSSLSKTDMVDTLRVPDSLEFIVITIVIILICLCGMVGNGTVIWLLGFHMKKNPYSIYILNLAVADFTYLLCHFLDCTFYFLNIRIYWMTEIPTRPSYMAGLSLLMAISVERCISVLWPLWYKCYRPVHLSTFVCAVIWVLCFSFSLMFYMCHYFGICTWAIGWRLYNLMSFIIFLVLLVSTLMLFIQVQCYSQQRQPSRLYWTILLNVLAFLLLNVPSGFFVAITFSKDFDYVTWSLLILFSIINSTVNPIIYFFVGHHGQRHGRKPLREVFQRALTDVTEEATREEEAPSPDRASGGGTPPNPHF